MTISTDHFLAWLDCTVVDRHPAGTHVIYVGRVEVGRVVQPEARPLVYWDRGYQLAGAEAPRLAAVEAMIESRHCDNEDLTTRREVRPWPT